MNDSKGNLLLYQTEDGQTKIEVTLANDTVWLTADQMAELFQRNKSTISRHIKNVFESGELKPDMVVAFFATTTQHGAIKGKHHSFLQSRHDYQRRLSCQFPSGCPVPYLGNTSAAGIPYQRICDE